MIPFYVFLAIVVGQGGFCWWLGGRAHKRLIEQQRRDHNNQRG
jgi:hypothetical protein